MAHSKDEGEVGTKTHRSGFMILREKLDNCVHFSNDCHMPSTTAAFIFIYFF